MTAGADSGNENRVMSGLYAGPTGESYTARGVRTIEAGFSELHTSVDQLILSRLQDAEAHGRREITVLDIGSGPKGNLMADFLSDPIVGMQTREFLAGHEEMTIHFLGCTDAPSPELHLMPLAVEVPSGKLLPEEAALNGRIRATNVAYSLSRTQNLASFLRAMKVDRLDLVFATHSLMYLGPSVFRDTVQTVADRLNEHGKCIAVGLSYPLGFRGMPPQLDVRGISADPPSRKQVLKDHTLDTGMLAVMGRKEDPRIDSSTFGEAAAVYKRLGVLTEEDLAARRGKVEKSLRNKQHLKAYRSVPARRVLAAVAQAAFSRAHEQLAGRHEQTLAARKQEILRSISGVTVDFFRQSAIGPDGFVLTKPSPA